MRFFNDFKDISDDTCPGYILGLQNPCNNLFLAKCFVDFGRCFGSILGILMQFLGLYMRRIPRTLEEILSFKDFGVIRAPQDIW
jgi:hypothetical protein